MSEPSSDHALSHVQATPSTPVTLEDLLKSAAPLLQTYVDAQAKEQERNLEHEARVLVEDSRRHRIVVWSSVLTVLAVLVIAGIQVWKGRDDAAMDLIQLVVAVAGAGFGGWGIASRSINSTPGES